MLAQNNSRFAANELIHKSTNHYWENVITTVNNLKASNELANTTQLKQISAALYIPHHLKEVQYNFGIHLNENLLRLKMQVLRSSPAMQR